MYAVVLRMGESDRNARHKKPVPKGVGEAAGGYPNMVLSYYFPFLRTHQLRRRRSFG